MPVSDYVLITYRPDLQLLIMRWTRPATPAEHRAGYQAALALARQQQVGRWLIDLRSRGLADPADLLWVMHDFRQEFRTALPTAARRIAYFTTPYHADILSARLRELEAATLDGLQLAVFVEETPAYQWLVK
ncbi:hypothetical protein KLP40_03445 [Hymenobacter sp. NST-14]|uniref:hypothetical protein n=1 Tax=Hymenobacter piscis TaxID=2839984 RepID=UPI001C03A27C|nr:hypothetical protein [Hymenobacter piscis]MBT9392207.1 hypothetical protein [Hymenobacter piscis]